MSWLALLLVGYAVADLVFSLVHAPAHSSRRMRHVPEAIAAGVVIVLGLLAGLTGPRDLTGLVVLATATLGWGECVTRCFGRGRPALPLVYLALTLAGAVLLAPLAPDAGGPLQRWLDATPLPVVGGASADRALLLTGALLVQLSTGNVLVRLVLGATGTISPLRQDAVSEPETQLKGGRLLGPMERLLILGLGLAGQLTAASIVVAAKGLLRFPELSSKREQVRIHLLTEYFLVGSFVSWLLALGTLVLLAR